MVENDCHRQSVNYDDPLFQNVLETINKIENDVDYIEMNKHNIDKEITNINEMCETVIKSNNLLTELEKENAEKSKILKETNEKCDQLKVNCQQLCTEIGNLNRTKIYEKFKRKLAFYEQLTGTHFYLPSTDDKHLRGFIKNKNIHYIEPFNINISSSNQDKVSEILFNKIAEAKSTNWNDLTAEALI